MWQGHFVCIYSLKIIMLYPSSTALHIHSTQDIQIGRLLRRMQFFFEQHETYTPHASSLCRSIQELRTKVGEGAFKETGSFYKEVIKEGGKRNDLLR